MQTTLLLKQVSQGIRSHQEGPTKSGYLLISIPPRISQREVFNKFGTILHFRNSRASIGTSRELSSSQVCCKALQAAMSQRQQTVT